MRRIVLGAAFCALMALMMEAVAEERTIDGSGNTMGGVAGARLIRVGAADYPANNSGEKIHQEPNVPNARDVSNVIAAQAELLANDRQLSDMVWAWGQFVDHDIDLTDGRPANGTAPIEILDPEDPLGPNPIPFTRSDYDPDTGSPQNPRQQINAITSFIDASNVYGSDGDRADFLRAHVGGRLKTSPGDLLPFNDSENPFPNAGGPSDQLFLAGDVRANEHVGLTAFHTLFVREHNHLADKIAHKDRNATDEEIYQLARKIVGAEIQRITYNEFLPALLGPYAPSLAAYQGWDPNVDPSVSNEFSTAIYRFGHSMLSPQLLLADNKGVAGSIRLRDAFFTPDFLVNNPENVELLLNGFTKQHAQEVDTLVVDDVRDFLFGTPGQGGLDLASLNIQRGRDHGMPHYNAMRVAYGLEPVETVDDISSNPSTQEALTILYDSVDEIDAWVGGLAEDHLPGASVGALVAIGIADQFTRLRDGDRFFYLNDPELDTKFVEHIIKLDKLTLADVIRRNTGIRKIQDNVFLID